MRIRALGLVLPLWVACASTPDGRLLAGGDLHGRLHSVEATRDDTLTDLARRFDLGYLELVSANPDVDPWLPGGRDVVIPALHLLPDVPREGIVINLAEQRLYLFEADGRLAATHPIGVGRDGYETPLGTTTVVRKREKPTWYPPASARRDDPTLGRSVPPGPDNPLGEYALYLGWPSYLVHGTNEPDGVGRRVSRGCIRLFPEDIEAIYARVEIGTPVRVIDEPIKLGRRGETLYLEAHPSLRQADALELGEAIPTEEVPGLTARLEALAAPGTEPIDWEVVERAVAARAGVPVAITRVVATERSFWEGLRTFGGLFDSPTPTPTGSTGS